VPEYLAAGKPVVSTSIVDVVRDYGDSGLVSIADEPQQFIAAAEKCMSSVNSDWLAAADERLSSMSWDATWSSMAELIDAAIAARRTRTGSEMKVGA